MAIYGSLIEKWLLSRGVERQAVDDIRQEVMAVVIRDLRQFEHNGKPGAFRNWLRTITVHRMRQHWDKSRRNRAADIQTMADQLTDPDSSLSRLWNEEHDRYLLQRLLEIVAQRVHPRTFQAFRRVAILEEPVLKVAADLDMKPGAVRVAQSRVLRALRQEGRGLLDESLDNS